MTNNPRKLAALKNAHINVVERVPLQEGRNPSNQHYLKTKANKLGHMFDPHFVDQTEWSFLAGIKSNRQKRQLEKAGVLVGISKAALVKGLGALKIVFDDVIDLSRGF